MSMTEVRGASVPVRWARWLGRVLTGKRKKKPADPTAQWFWILPEPFGNAEASDGVAANTVTWFVPPVGQGSGGHLNVFRFVHMLEQRGFDCRIVVCHEMRNINAQAAREQIRNWFFPLKAAVYMHPAEAVPSSYFAIATGWQTAYAVRAFRGARQPVYFVQDFEPSFHGSGSIAAFAENTYRFGFPAVTAGSWLARLMHDNYGLEAHALGFGLDHSLYQRVEPAPRKGRHVFFYARPPTERRGFELGLLALKLLCSRMPDVTVHLAGWPLDKFKIPFPHESHGLMSVDQLPALYSACEVALVFSFSNVSLLPLEIMACGTPVVSNRGAHVEWLLNDGNAMLVDAAPEAVCSAIQRLLTDDSLRYQLSSAGLRAATAADWSREGDRMAEILAMLAESGARAVGSADAPHTGGPDDRNDAVTFGEIAR